MDKVEKYIMKIFMDSGSEYTKFIEAQAHCRVDIEGELRKIHNDGFVIIDMPNKNGEYKTALPYSHIKKIKFAEQE